jgi:hypothetical protein
MQGSPMRPELHCHSSGNFVIVSQNTGTNIPQHIQPDYFLARLPIILYNVRSRFLDSHT